MTGRERGCPLCGSSTGRRWVIREMMLGTREPFTYGECVDCGTLVLLEPPQDLGRFYPDSYYSFATGVRRSPAMRLLRRLRGAAALRGHGRTAAALGRGKPPHWMPWFAIAGIGRDAAVCDIGCGNGELLLDLAAAGLRTAVGIDPMAPRLIDSGRVRIERTTATAFASDPGNAGRFDLVMFNHSFEHLPEPSADLEAARELLTNDGTMMLRLPLLGGWAWRHYGTDWVGLDAPRHLFVPTIAGIETALRRAGLEIREILYDSSELQFWRSEQYADDIGLFEPGSYAIEGSRFSREQLLAWRRRAVELNRIGDGDTAAVFAGPATAARARPQVPRQPIPVDPGTRPVRVGIAAMDPLTPGGVTAMVAAWRTAGLGRPGGPIELIPIPTSAWDSSPVAKVAQMGRATARTVALLASGRLDVVHLNASTGASLRRKLLLARCCRAAGVPTIAHMHSGSFEGWVQASPRNRRLARSLLASASIAIVLSERWAGLARQLGAREVEVLANGIPAAQRIELEQIAARRGRQGSSHPPVLLFYGRWGAVKGLDVLAAALAELQTDGAAAFELRVFGNGDRAWAESVLQPVAASTTLGGWLAGAQKVTELERASVVVAPSRHEGMPTALIEARAAGLPIVASDVGAVREVIGDYPAATLVPPGDPRALREAIAPLLVDRGEAADEGSRRPDHVAKLPARFRAEEGARRLESIYAELAGRLR